MAESFESPPKNLSSYLKPPVETGIKLIPVPDEWIDEIKTETKSDSEAVFNGTRFLTEQEYSLLNEKAQKEYEGSKISVGKYKEDGDGVLFDKPPETLKSSLFSDGKAKVNNLLDIKNVNKKDITSGFDSGLNPGVVIPKDFFKDAKGGPSPHGMEPVAHGTLVTESKKDFKVENDIDYSNFSTPPSLSSFNELLDIVSNKDTSPIDFMDSLKSKEGFDDYQKKQDAYFNGKGENIGIPKYEGKLSKVISGDSWSDLGDFGIWVKDFTNDVGEAVDKAFEEAAEALVSAADSDGYKEAKNIILEINSYLPKGFKFPALELLEKIDEMIFSKNWVKSLIIQRGKVDENLLHKYYNAEITAIRTLLGGSPYFNVKGDGKFREAITESLKGDQFWNLNESLTTRKYGEINQAARSFGIPQLIKESSETKVSRKNYTIEWKMASMVTGWSAPGFDLDDENDPHHFNSSFAYNSQKVKIKIELDDIKSNTIIGFLKQNRDPANMADTALFEKSAYNFKQMYYLGKDIQEGTNISPTTNALKLGSFITKTIEGETAEDTKIISTYETLGGDLIKLFNGEGIFGLYEEIADLAVKLHKKMASLSPLDEENANLGSDALNETLTDYLGVHIGKNRNSLLPLSIKVLINGADRKGNTLGQLQKQDTDFKKLTGIERNTIFVDIEQRKEATTTKDAQQNVKVYLSDKTLGPFNNFNLSINSPIMVGFDPNDLGTSRGNGPYLNRANKSSWVSKYSKYNNSIDEYEKIKNNSIKSLLKAFPDFYSNMFDIALVWVENYDDLSLTFKSNKDKKINDEINKTWLSFLTQMPSSFQNPNKYVSFDSSSPPSFSSANSLTTIDDTVVKIASEGFSVRVASVEIPQGMSESFETSFMTTKIFRVASKTIKEHKSVLSMNVDQELYYTDCINALASQYSMTIEKVFNPMFNKVDIVQQNKYLKNLFPYIMSKKTGHWNIYVNMINLSPMQSYINNNAVVTESKKMPVYVFEDVKFLGQNDGFSFTRDSANKLIAQFPFIYRRDYKIDLV
jgi:hypothetical protein